MIFRLKLSNLPKFIKDKDLKKTLKELNLIYRSIKKAPSWSHGFILFDVK